MVNAKNFFIILSSCLIEITAGLPIRGRIIVIYRGLLPRRLDAVRREIDIIRPHQQGCLQHHLAGLQDPR